MEEEGKGEKMTPETSREDERTSKREIQRKKNRERGKSSYEAIGEHMASESCKPHAKSAQA